MWLGFLRYYLFEFNRDKYVVTIRQKNLLIRFVKMWRSLFAIEGESTKYIYHDIIG